MSVNETSQSCDYLSATPSVVPPNGSLPTCPVMPRVLDIERGLKNQTRILAVVVGAVSLVAPQLSEAVSIILSLFR